MTEPPRARTYLAIRVRASGGTWLVTRFIPESWREAHRLYAALCGFFWLSCPLCRCAFGGHEWRDIDGKPGQIPDTFDPGEGRTVAICPPCTRAGRGAHTPLVQRYPTALEGDVSG